MKKNFFLYTLTVFFVFKNVYDMIISFSEDILANSFNVPSWKKILFVVFRPLENAHTWYSHNEKWE